MQPLQHAHLLLLLALLVLCTPFGQVGKAEQVPANLSSTPGIPVSNLSPLCGSPPILSIALALAVAFFLRLR